jgi:hypothetical protein
MSLEPNSRRDFIQSSARNVALLALMAKVPLLAKAAGEGPTLMIAGSGTKFGVYNGGAPVCLMSENAIADIDLASMTATNSGDAEQGTSRHLRMGDWEVIDKIMSLESGVFEWRRDFRNISHGSLQAEFRMEVSTCYAPEFFLIPGASYNGNVAHGRMAASGLSIDGVPRIFSALRSTVPASTYSEGHEWSVFLFAAAEAPSLECGCSMLPDEDAMVHRLIWPGQDNIKSGTIPDGCRTMAVDAGQTFSVRSFLVVAPVAQPRRSWSKGLDAAWKLNRHDIRPAFPPARLWDLGIQYARDSLWYEKDDFTGFSVGLVRKGDRWEPRGEVRFESGWCGQNASLGVAMLYDYVRSHHAESLNRGMRALDFWCDHGRLSCGLFYTHFDVKLGAQGMAPYGWGPYNATFLGRPAGPGERYVDTCNLGYGAYFYLLASEVAERCGQHRPQWKQLGLDTCDFFVENALPDGTFGKAWSLDGKCVATGATTGSHILWPLLKAYRMTGDGRYLSCARRGFDGYLERDLDKVVCWGSALDADCIDRESGQPMLLAALDLYEITGERKYLQAAELAGYYLASWQWHYSAPFSPESQIARTGYDIFGGTSISARGPGIDPWGEFLALGWMRLAKATGNHVWRDRGIQAFNQATLGVSDGALVLNGLARPAGSQNESMGLGLSQPCGRMMKGNYNDWLVAWPAALRLITLSHWTEWSDFSA